MLPRTLRSVRVITMLHPATLTPSLIDHVFACHSLQRYHDVLGRLLSVARMLQAPLWSASDFQAAQRAVNAFVLRYCELVALFPREEVPKDERSLLSTSFPKLHVLAHIPNAIFDFGNKNQFSAGQCVTVSTVPA